jgi:hypothetical protein
MSRLASAFVHGDRSRKVLLPCCMNGKGYENRVGNCVSLASGRLWTVLVVFCAGSLLRLYDQRLGIARLFLRSIYMLRHKLVGLKGASLYTVFCSASRERVATAFGFLLAKLSGAHGASRGVPCYMLALWRNALLYCVGSMHGSVLLAFLDGQRGAGVFARKYFRDLVDSIRDLLASSIRFFLFRSSSFWWSGSIPVGRFALRADSNFWLSGNPSMAAPFAYKICNFDIHNMGVTHA